ncbi:MAG: glycosyltransferase family 4 protein [Acidobacteriota bacterium]
MRLLIASSEFPPGPGGIGTHACELARQLVGYSWGVTVVARQDYASPDAIDAFAETVPFDVERLRPVRGKPVDAAYRWWRLEALRRRVRPDVMIATGERMTWLLPSIARYVPWVAIAHGTELGAPTTWSGRLTCRSLRRADGVICVSEHTRGVMHDAGVRPLREAVIPNGADASRFQPLDPDERERRRRRLGFEGRRVILTVGHVSRRKGQEVVIRALPQVVAKCPDVLYVMVGYPTEREFLTTLAKELGVTGHVSFAGVVDAEDVPVYAACADLFAMTSRLTEDGDFEGYGIAVVEGALCGLPAVVADGSGLVEAIAPGDTGLAARQNDPDSTAEALLTLLTDDDLRSRMGAAARQRAITEQTWGHRVGQYDAFLRQVVQREGRSAP